MGDMGDKGLVGDRGENGTKGDIGMTGDMGDKGTVTFKCESSWSIYPCPLFGVWALVGYTVGVMDTLGMSILSFFQRLSFLQK